MTPQNISEILLLEYIGLAIMYGFAGDWRRCVYFIGATILTVGVIF